MSFQLQGAVNYRHRHGCRIRDKYGNRLSSAIIENLSRNAVFDKFYAMNYRKHILNRYFR